jgi:hypothetical protein
MAFRVFVAVTASLLVAASAAHATTMAMSGSYTAVAVAANPSYAPTINDDGNPSFLSASFSGTLGVGQTTTPTTFLQIGPVSGGSSVGTQTGAIDVVMTLMAPNNSAVTSVTTSAGGNGAYVSGGAIHFAANYELFYSNQTDCLTWDGTTCTTNANGNINTSIGETVTVDFADGAVLGINLYNWSDWDMMPDISFNLIAGPTSVPEPGTLAMFGSAIAGLAMLRRRRDLGHRTG